MWQLPFTWQLLYFAALAFGLSGLLFRSSQPEFLRRYDGYDDYRRQGHPKSHLRTGWIDWIMAPKRRIRETREQTPTETRIGRYEVIRAKYFELEPRLDKDEVGSFDFIDVLNAIDRLEPEFPENPDLFWSIWRSLDEDYKPYQRRAISLLNHVGMLLLAVVFLQNLVSVICLVGGEGWCESVLANFSW